MLQTLCSPALPLKLRGKTAWSAVEVTHSYKRCHPREAAVVLTMSVLTVDVLGSPDCGVQSFVVDSWYSLIVRLHINVRMAMLKAFHQDAPTRAFGRLTLFWYVQARLPDGLLSRAKNASRSVWPIATLLPGIEMQPCRAGHRISDSVAALVVPSAVV